MTAKARPSIASRRRARSKAPGEARADIAASSTCGDPEHTRLLHALERAASEWRTTFDAVETPLVIVNGDLTVARINRAARMLAGHDYGEIIGRPLEALGSEEPWISLHELATRVVQSRNPEAKQVTDQAGRTVDLLAMLFNQKDPSEDRVIVIAWDVTPLIDLQKRLEQQRTMATLGSLVAGVAHEVRNPLFAISATVDALEQAAPPQLGEYFSVLREEIDRMTELMQDLLAYGRRSNAPYQVIQTDTIVDGAIRASSPLAQRHGVTLRKRGKDARVFGDRERLTRAVQNLIDNAIQHSKSGGAVEITLHGVRRAKSKFVEICVRDRGNGFAADDLPRVFEPFYSKRKGGTGLGLSLVQQIVTEHGGDVTARNADGGGAEVGITLAISE